MSNTKNATAAFRLTELVL